MQCGAKTKANWDRISPLACNRVLIVSIGYKTASAITPAAPPAMMPSVKPKTKI